MKKDTHLTIWVVCAIIISSFFVWLAADFRSGGALGVVQNYSQWVYFIPYLLGVTFGKDSHNPNDIAFAGGIFIEILFIMLAIRYIFIKRKNYGL